MTARIFIVNVFSPGICELFLPDSKTPIRLFESKNGNSLLLPFNANANTRFRLKCTPFIIIEGFPPVPGEPVDVFFVLNINGELQSVDNGDQMIVFLQIGNKDDLE